MHDALSWKWKTWIHIYETESIRIRSTKIYSQFLDFGVWMVVVIRKCIRFMNLVWIVYIWFFFFFSTHLFSDPEFRLTMARKDMWIVVSCFFCFWWHAFVVYVYFICPLSTHSVNNSQTNFSRCLNVITFHFKRIEWYQSSTQSEWSTSENCRSIPIKGKGVFLDGKLFNFKQRTLSVRM